jgi:hypothetical protein
MPSRSRVGAELVLALVVFAAALGIYSLNGHQGYLFRDDAVFVYGGQQLARGVPPYVSTFEAKLPLATLLCGGGVLLAQALGQDDLLVVRFLFLGLGALCVVAVHLLARELLGSRQAGLLAAAVFVGFWGYGLHALSGPHAKAPMVLFESLSLLLAARRRWFAAALAGSCAFLFWQPMLVYALAPVALAVLQPGPGGSRWRSLLAATGGAALPVALLLCLFLAMGGLREMIEAAFVFNLTHLERVPRSLADHLAAAARVVRLGFPWMGVPIVLGLLTTCALYPWRLARSGGSARRLLREDPWAALLVTFPLPVAWSLRDFQSYPDFFVFLPYVALGCAALLHLAFESFEARGWLPPRARRPALLLVCAALVALAGFQYAQQRRDLLPLQRQWAEHVGRLAREGSLVSIGVPEALVLLHRTNPNPYVQVCCGMTGWIDARTPGGLDGWLMEIHRGNPGVILMELGRGHAARRLEVLLGSEYRKLPVGHWMAYVRNAPGAPGS